MLLKAYDLKMNTKPKPTPNNVAEPEEKTREQFVQTNFCANMCANIWAFSQMCIKQIFAHKFVWFYIRPLDCTPLHCTELHYNTI